IRTCDSVDPDDAGGGFVARRTRSRRSRMRPTCSRSAWSRDTSRRTGSRSRGSSRRSPGTVGRSARASTTATRASQAWTPAHDPATGFVPSYVRDEPFLARSLVDKAKIDGMGACMALRRRIWTELGGFDERFGAGGPFHAADEGEFALRALQAGWFVYETPAVSVLHRGFRGRTEAHALVHRYAYGTGAMMA